MLNWVMNTPPAYPKKSNIMPKTNLDFVFP